MPITGPKSLFPSWRPLISATFLFPSPRCPTMLLPCSTSTLMTNLPPTFPISNTTTTTTTIITIPTPSQHPMS